MSASMFYAFCWRLVFHLIFSSQQGIYEMCHIRTLRAVVILDFKSWILSLSLFFFLSQFIFLRFSLVLFLSLSLSPPLKHLQLFFHFARCSISLRRKTLEFLLQPCYMSWHHYNYIVYNARRQTGTHSGVKNAFFIQMIT